MPTQARWRSVRSLIRRATVSCRVASWCMEVGLHRKGCDLQNSVGRIFKRRKSVTRPCEHNMPAWHVCRNKLHVCSVPSSQKCQFRHFWNVAVIYHCRREVSLKQKISCKTGSFEYNPGKILVFQKMITLYLHWYRYMAFTYTDTGAWPLLTLIQVHDLYLHWYRYMTFTYIDTSTWPLLTLIHDLYLHWYRCMTFTYPDTGTWPLLTLIQVHDLYLHWYRYMTFTYTDTGTWPLLTLIQVHDSYLPWYRYMNYCILTLINLNEALGPTNKFHARKRLLSETLL